MTLIKAWLIKCNRAMCNAALPVPGATEDEARANAATLGWTSRIFEAINLGGAPSRSIGDCCPDHPSGQLELRCSTPWTPGALLHCADCPMTNTRAAARTSCTCAELGQPRDTREGWGP